MALNDLEFGAAPAASNALTFAEDDSYGNPNDLLFSKPVATSNDLLFGDDGDGGVPVIPDFPATFGEDFPFGGNVRVGFVFRATIAEPFAFDGEMVGRYVSGAARPMVGEVAAAWEKGVNQEAGLQSAYQKSTALPAASNDRWQRGLALSVSVVVAYQDADNLSVQRSTAWQEAVRLQGTTVEARWQETLRDRRRATSPHWQQAIHLSADATALRWQETLRDRRRRADAHWQNGVPLTAQHTEPSRDGRPVGNGFGTRYQRAMRPPPGIWIRPTVPVVDPYLCYRPSNDLVFAVEWAADNNLVFICERHDTPPPQPGETVVVPVKKVYVVINTSSLYTVDAHIFLPTYGMSMSLDVDSWTWSFNASLPFAAYENVKHGSDGTPVEVECTVNGVAYRFKIKTISRDRNFADDGIAITGRGVADELDAPTAPILNFGNPAARTAQQLMADVLTLNGIALDWTIDWQLTDWLVPAGAWTKSGTYIEALNEIAGAAGGYVQPVPSARTLRVLPRYPLLPRDWATDALVDYELPDSIAIKESTEWVEKPRYNRVFVQGQKNGVRGRVTLAGTDGSLEAPTAVDALVTHADAARQRGISILGDTGRIANVGLNTSVGIRDAVDNPIGIIPPGKFIRYIENGVAKVGLSRSVDVAIGTPEIEQTIGVEFHELA